MVPPPKACGGWMLPFGNDYTLFGGPKVDVLLTDGGGHHAGEQVGSAGEGRDAESGEFGGEVLVVERRAFIAQGEKGDDLYAGLYKLVGALEQVLFHAAFVEVGNEHKDGIARIADQRLAVAHRAVDVRAAAELDAEQQIDGIVTAGTDVAVITIGKVCDELGLPGLSAPKMLE